MTNELKTHRSRSVTDDCIHNLVNTAEIFIPSGLYIGINTEIKENVSLFI